MAEPIEHEATAPPDAKITPPNDGVGRDLPAAGPHAKPDLTDEERTPGAGTLPETGEADVGDGASS